MFFLLIILLTIVLLTCLYISRVRHMSKLSRNGIPGPKPNLIYGNLFEYRALPSVKRHDEWIKKYGKIVGYYNGARPQVLVADPDLAKNIQIKDFHCFTDRPTLQLRHGIQPIPANSGTLTRAQGKRWKQMRSTLTPTFSAAKLKTMTPIVNSAIDDFLSIVDKKSESEDEFDIYDMFQNLTTDVIGRSAFGIQSNVQNEDNNKFLNAAKDIFNLKLNQWMTVLIVCYPQLDYVLYPLRRLMQIINEWRGLSANGILHDMAKEIIQLRRKNPDIKRKDLLQLMFDTKISSEEMSAMTDDKLTITSDEVVDTTKKSIKNGVNKVGKSDISLTDEEIQANCVLFYEAGYETTSTVLGYMAHIVVNYPEVQEKVREEVKQLYESEGKLDFNTVSKLQYLECVINETMRIYPPVITFVSRECIEDYKYKDMTIPKGSAVMIATYYMHHDPDYWPQHETFDPMRFAADRKHQIYPSSWQPFGSGPRNCIGLRFALFEAKLALAKLLMKYRLEPSPKTEMGDITTQCKLLTLTPKNGVYVKAVRL